MQAQVCSLGDSSSLVRCSVESGRSRFAIHKETGWCRDIANFYRRSNYDSALKASAVLASLIASDVRSRDSFKQLTNS